MPRVGFQGGTLSLGNPILLLMLLFWALSMLDGHSMPELLPDCRQTGERRPLEPKHRNTAILGRWFFELYVYDGGFKCAYSAFACVRMGMSRSASFQSVKKSWYAFFAFNVSFDMAYARPSCSLAKLPSTKVMLA